MANIREAFDYAAKNPTSDFANNLKQLASSGALDVEAKANGIDLTPFKPKPVAVADKPRSELTPEEKMQRDTNNAAGVVGGKEVAQGLGQAIANKKINKANDAAQTEAMKIQGDLIARIHAKRATGEDTSRLEEALTALGGSIDQAGQDRAKLLNQSDLTDEAVIGSALQLATTAAGGKIAGGATKIVGEGTGIIAGAAKGAASGALAGAGVGALEGAASGMKKNKSAKDVLKDAGTGAAVGAIGGAALGTVTGAVSGKIKANQLKKQGFVADLVSPKMTPAVKEQAIREGRVTEAGVFNPAKVTPSNRDLQLADAVDGVVSDKKSILQNVTAVDNKVGEINTGVKAYVKDNKVPFNTNQLKSKLNSGKSDLKLIFASDQNAEKTYNAVVKEFMKHVDSKDTAGLLDARQEFDKIPAIKKLLDSQGLGENVKKEIVLTARTKANEYIAELLPEGNTYRADLLKESRMIEAIGNMAEKSTGIIGKNKLQLLTEKYPVLKWITGAAAGAASVGVGGALIGSSD